MLHYYFSYQDTSFLLGWCNACVPLNVLSSHDAVLLVNVHWSQRCTGVDFSSFDSLEEAQAAASKALEQQTPDQDGSRSAGLRNIQSAASTGQVLAECFETAVESTLQQPTFVLDFPVEISPLAKQHRSKPGLVERFELYIAGQGWEKRR